VLKDGINSHPADHRREALWLCSIVRLTPLFPVADEANLFEDA
jgi:hypothetical protein